MSISGNGHHTIYDLPKPQPDFGPQENQKGDAIVQQVAGFWKSLGLTFPLEGVLERN